MRRQRSTDMQQTLSMEAVMKIPIKQCRNTHARKSLGCSVTCAQFVKKIYTSHDCCFQ
jgi:hypothetical protein